MPAEFKRQIEEKYGNKFYITSRDGKTAEVHPIEEWEKIEQKLALMPNSNPAKKKLLNLVSYYGQMAEMDTQGRVLVPQILRETAKVIGDVVVFGKLTYPGSHQHGCLPPEHGSQSADGCGCRSAGRVRVVAVEEIAPQGAHGRSRRHVPVLLEEAIEFLRILPGGTYMDATLGLGGHSTAIARLLGPEGHLIAFDRDPEAIESAEARFAALRAELKEQMPRITIHAAAFAERRAGRNRRASTEFWPTLGSARCNWTRHREDSVFRQTHRSTCGWTRAAE